MQIRKMTEGDIGEIAEIERECFSFPWSENSLKEELTNPFADFLVCEEDGKIAAYGGMQTLFEDAHVLNVATKAEYRRMGYARALMKALEGCAEGRNAERMMLEVRESNEKAIRLYRSLGFRVVGIEAGGYQKPRENALLMEKNIAKAEEV